MHMRCLSLAVILLLLFCGQALSQTQTNQEYRTAPGEESVVTGWFCPWCDFLEQTEMGEIRTEEPEQVREYGFEEDLVIQIGPEGQRITTPLNRDEARILADEYIAGETNITVGEVMEEGGVYRVQVLDQEGEQVGSYLIDQESGWFKRVEEE
ncbi:MAG: hypothetical protein ACOC0U_02510 [Desulfovibrionales bacterium]